MSESGNKNIKNKLKKKDIFRKEQSIKRYYCPILLAYKSFDVLMLYIMFLIDV